MTGFCGWGAVQGGRWSIPQSLHEQSRRDPCACLLQSRQRHSSVCVGCEVNRCRCRVVAKSFVKLQDAVAPPQRRSPAVVSLRQRTRRYYRSVHSRLFMVPSATSAATKERGGEEERTEDGIFVQNVSFTWPNGRQVLKGQLCMVVGPNGCGKSTLVRTIGNYLFADTGVIRVQKPMGIVFQDPADQMLLPTVYMEVLSGTPDDMPLKDRLDLAASTMRTVGILDIAKKQTLEISGGQQQRVATATMLVRNPKVMLFDEVTASLDQESKQNVLGLVKSIIKERAIAGLWVTHVYDELPLADRIILLKDGRVFANGTYEEIEPLLSLLWDDEV